MKVAKNLAVIGATGAVGRELLATLEKRDFPVKNLRLLASPRSAGNTMEFRGENLLVEELDERSFAGVDIALFSAGKSISRKYAAVAADAGALVIDNSSAFRMDPQVPLVVPEVNPSALADHQGIVANPNCSTIILVMALHPLHGEGLLRRVIVSTYQAASGGGQRAMEEMFSMSRAALDGRSFDAEVLPHSLAFNLYPQVDVFTDGGHTKEEDKMVFETRKIMGLPDLAIDVTCVRVPVARCHSEAVTVELGRAVTPARAREVLAGFPGVQVQDDPGSESFPQPISVTGRDDVVVGRIRASRTFDPGLNLWVVGDQLLKGAALNAIQIAEHL